MPDGVASVGFSGSQRFILLKSTIRNAVRGLITELQKDREANHAVQTALYGAFPRKNLDLLEITDAYKRRMWNARRVKDDNSSPP